MRADGIIKKKKKSMVDAFNCEIEFGCAEKKGKKNGMFFNGSRTQVQVKTTYIKGKHFHANLHASGNRFD